MVIGLSRGHFDVEANDTSQCRRDKQGLGVVRNGVEANDEVWVSQLTLMLLHIVVEICSVPFFTPLDRNHDSRMPASQFLTRLNRQNCREKCIAVVVRASPEK